MGRLRGVSRVGSIRRKVAMALSYPSDEAAVIGTSRAGKKGLMSLSSSADPASDKCQHWTDDLLDWLIP